MTLQVDACIERLNLKVLLLIIKVLNEMKYGLAASGFNTALSVTH